MMARFRQAAGAVAVAAARAALVLALLLPVARPAGAVDSSGMGMEDRKFAELQGLDKVTGRVNRLTVAVGQNVHFGTLDITVRACRVPPPIEPPNPAAFLEIDDTRPGQARQRLFSGWMFAASPALSALEHPVYDVWLIDCSNDDNTSSSPPR